MPPKNDEWVNVSDHAVTLASGEPLDAYGGRGHSDMSDPHDRALRDGGLLALAETETDYEAQSTEQLTAEAARRELTVDGTGANGNVLKKDLIAALQAADDKEKS